MSRSDDRIRGWVDSVVERSRDRLRDDLTELVSTLTDEMAARHAEAAEQARREGEAAARAVADAQAAEREATLEGAAGLLEAIRALDSAPTLSAVLDELALAASRFTDRAAVLVRRDDTLCGWAWHGFPESAGSPRDYVCSVADAGIAGLAVQAAEPRSGGPPDARGVLRPSRPDRVALAIPIRAGGDVVAVVYADNDGERAGTDGGGTMPVVPSAWPELVETLARHAGRCLESVMTRSLPALVRAGVEERARRRTLRSDDEAAERYARLLVAEIKLYHEGLVDEARRERDLLRRLRPQIERAQQLYEERVAPAVRARTRYFEQELVRTLAGGDASLLGQPS
jgi:hypothetical protein